MPQVAEKEPAKKAKHTHTHTKKKKKEKQHTHYDILSNYIA